MIQEKCRQLTSSTPRYGVIIFGHNVNNIQSIGDKAVPMSGSLSKTPLKRGLPEVHCYVLHRKSSQVGREGEDFFW
jgi:hypothetical protein